MSWRCRRYLSIVILLASGRGAWADGIEARAKPSDSRAVKSEAKPAATRRIFILHSGVHTIFSDPWKNIAAETLREGLRKRGICEQDIIVLEIGRAHV